MGQFKQLLIEAFEQGYAYSKDYWHEDSQALADAEEAFQHWVQLELDLQDNRRGMGGECDL
jgi:hypothetical protein